MICFETLSFKNFLSVGNYDVSINLNQHKTTLVFGMNGSGKSTILDALCYALYNKPFRRINLPQLINSQNKKGLLTEVVFTIGKDQFTVIRGQKPKVFKVYRNGEELDSQASDKDNQAYLEQNILRLSYKSFTQIVILGSSNYIPFMQLAPAGRRDCVEDFLDIKVFSAMSMLAKDRLRAHKETLKDLKASVGQHEFKIDIQEQYIKDLQKKASANTADICEKIQSQQDEAEKLQVIISGLEERIQAQKDLLGELSKAGPHKKRETLFGVIAKLQTKIEDNENSIGFYNDNDTCHTCKQALDPAVKKKAVSSAKRNIKKYGQGVEEAQAQVYKYEDSIRVLENNAKYITTLTESLKEYQYKRDTISGIIRHLQQQVEDLKVTSNTDKEEGKLEAMKELMEEQKTELYAAITLVEEHEIVNNLLKDSGIKAQIVKKYLPVMNKLIRKHLELFDLPIYFNLDEEFNETVQSPIHQDFSYASFSEGQKSRIDLALMFTWREIGKIKNSVTTNLLILDEVFSSSLDEDGKERLINFLRYRLDDSQRIVVVDHTLSETFKEKFDENIEVRRTGGFSRYLSPQ